MHGSLRSSLLDSGNTVHPGRDHTKNKQLSVFTSTLVLPLLKLLPLLPLLSPKQTLPAVRTYAKPWRTKGRPQCFSDNRASNNTGRVATTTVIVADLSHDAPSGKTCPHLSMWEFGGQDDGPLATNDLLTNLDINTFKPTIASSAAPAANVFNSIGDANTRNAHRKFETSLRRVIFSTIGSPAHLAS